MSEVTVSKCKCKNEYQDKKYGDGNRVMNVADKRKIGTSPVIECTVCGSIKSSAS